MSDYLKLLEEFSSPPLGDPSESPSFLPEVDPFQPLARESSLPEQLREQHAAVLSKSTAPGQAQKESFITQLKMGWDRGKMRGLINKHVVDARNDGDEEAEAEIGALAKQMDALQQKDPLGVDLGAATFIGDWTLDASQSLNATIRSLATSVAIELGIGAATGAAITAVSGPGSVAGAGIGGFIGAVRGLSKAATVARRSRSILKRGSKGRYTTARETVEVLQDAGNKMGMGTRLQFTAAHVDTLAKAQTAARAISVVAVGSQFAKEGQGEFILRMRDRDLDPSLVDDIAPLVGWIYGGIEAVETFNPWARAGVGASVSTKVGKKFRELVDNTVIETLANLGTQHGILAVKESLEEMGQEFVVGRAVALGEKRAKAIQGGIATEFEMKFEKGLIEGIKNSPDIFVTPMGETIVEAFEAFKHALGPSLILSGLSSPGTIQQAVSDTGATTRELARDDEKRRFMQSLRDAGISQDEIDATIESAYNTRQEADALERGESVTSEVNVGIARVVTEVLEGTPLDSVEQSDITEINRALMADADLLKVLKQEKMLSKVKVGETEDGKAEWEDGVFEKPADLVSFLNEIDGPADEVQNSVSDPEVEVKNELEFEEELAKLGRDPKQGGIARTRLVNKYLKVIANMESQRIQDDFIGLLPEAARSEVEGKRSFKDGVNGLANSQNIDLPSKIEAIKKTLHFMDQRVKKAQEVNENRMEKLHGVTRRLAESTFHRSLLENRRKELVEAGVGEEKDAVVGDRAQWMDDGVERFLDGPQEIVEIREGADGQPEAVFRLTEPGEEPQFLPVPYSNVSKVADEDGIRQLSELDEDISMFEEAEEELRKESEQIHQKIASNNDLDQRVNFQVREDIDRAVEEEIERVSAEYKRDKELLNVENAEKFLSDKQVRIAKKAKSNQIRNLKRRIDSSRKKEASLKDDLSQLGDSVDDRQKRDLITLQLEEELFKGYVDEYILGLVEAKRPPKAKPSKAPQTPTDYAINTEKLILDKDTHGYVFSRAWIFFKGAMNQEKTDGEIVKSAFSGWKKLSLEDFNELTWEDLKGMGLLPLDAIGRGKDDIEINNGRERAKIVKKFADHLKGGAVEQGKVIDAMFELTGGMEALGTEGTAMTYEERMLSDASLLMPYIYSMLPAAGWSPSSAGKETEIFEAWASNPSYFLSLNARWKNEVKGTRVDPTPPPDAAYKKQQEERLDQLDKEPCD